MGIFSNNMAKIMARRQTSRSVAKHMGLSRKGMRRYKSGGYKYKK